MNKPIIFTYENVDTCNQSEVKTRNIRMLQLTHQSSSVRFVKTCSHSRVAPFSPFHSNSPSFIPNLLSCSPYQDEPEPPILAARLERSRRGTEARNRDRTETTGTASTIGRAEWNSRLQSDRLSWLRVHAWTTEGRERIDEYNAVSLSSRAIQARRLSNRGRFEATRIRNFVIHKRNCKTIEKSERSFVTMHRAKRPIRWVPWNVRSRSVPSPRSMPRGFFILDIYRNLRKRRSGKAIWFVWYFFFVNDSHS